MEKSTWKPPFCKLSSKYSLKCLNSYHIDYRLTKRQIPGKPPNESLLMVTLRLPKNSDKILCFWLSSRILRPDPTN